MRNFDRGFMKPLLLREKEISLDEKLLYNFNRIHRRRLSKMASDPSFLIKTDDQSERRSQMSYVTRDRYAAVLPNRFGFDRSGDILLMS